MLITFASSVGGKLVNTYDPVIIKDWLNSYPYLYKGFTPNKGQIATMDGKFAENVIFYSRNGNMGIFITENGLSYVIYDIEKKEAKKDKEILPHIKEKPENSILHYARIDYELINAKIKKENIIYQDELPGYENFYLAHCPDGILFVKSYRKVIIKDIYPGIDWIFRYDDNGNFHHEFEIKDPQLISQIKLRVKYADIELADNGKSIILSTPIGKIKDGNLVGYQGKDIVEVSYKLIDNNLIAFDIKSFDKDKSLLIDPYALVWGTYYGGSNGECSFLGRCFVTLDMNGNVFVAGETSSTDFPTLNPGDNAYYQGISGGSGDAYLLKFSNSGIREWATYYGGDGSDVVYSIATDNGGNLFVTGNTNSINFPTYNPGGSAYFDGTCGTDGNCNSALSDAFILKFSNLGVRLWATYYGGSEFEYGSSIAIDGQGNVLVTGLTRSIDFPTLSSVDAYYQGSCSGCPSYADAFILKFTNLGVRVWATYYGGSSADIGFSIGTDNNDNVFVVGWTYSTDFPTYNPGGNAYYQGGNAGDADAFIIKFSNIGQRLWATYYGGSNIDWALSIATDIAGNVFVVGWTYSTNFPTYNPGGNAYYQGTNAGDADAFIIKFSNIGQRLWATYYGGSGRECNAYFCFVETNAEGKVFVVGYTLSTDFPTYNSGGGGYYQGTNAGSVDAFIVEFSDSLTRLWATYYGGSSDDWIASIANDTQDNIFVAGSSYSTNLPTYDPQNGAYYQTNAGSADAFIVKFSFTSTSISEYPIYTKSKLALNLFNLSTPIIIKLYSLDGKLVYSNTFKTNNIEINLKSLKSGIYILKAYSKDNKQLTYKFIKN